MSEGKWTRGPWKWHWRAGDESAPGSVYAEPHDGHVYAVAMMPRYQTEEQWEADASLIAAAPEMLEACEAALEYDAEIQKHAAANAKDPKSWVGCEKLDELYEKWISASRAAIAKAKGGE